VDPLARRAEHQYPRRLVNVMGDLLGSVAAIAAGAIIHFTGWVRIDPILSIFVSLLILKSTWASCASPTTS
jgi:Co/Zn/Cd efflux system component